MAQSKKTLAEADKKLKEIRKLGAKKEQRRFLVGPKKGVSQQDTLRMGLLRTNEQNLRKKGMQQKRVEGGFTKMVNGKEVKIKKKR